MLDVSQLIDPAQQQQQQQITVPELYPTTFPTSTTTTTSRAQYENLQSRQQSTPFPTTSTTSSSSRTQYENPQSHNRLQHSTTWPGGGHPSHASVQPAPQPPPDVLYATQPLYRQTQNKDSQNHPSQRQQQQPSNLLPRPRNNQNLDSNQMTPLSQPVVPPNTLNTGTPYTSQYNPPPSTSQHTRIHSSEYGHLPAAQRPPPSPNRQDMSLRPTRPGEGEGTSDRWRFNPGGAVSSSVPSASLSTCMISVYSLSWSPKVVPRPAQPVVPNIVRQPPHRDPTPPRPPSVPTCLILGCHEPVVEDLRTNELTEYCGEAHMRFVVSSSSLCGLIVLVC